MKAKKFVWLLMIIPVILTISCSKDDGTKSQTEPQPETEAPQYAGEEVTAPGELFQSSDPGAQEASMYINVANSFVALSQAMMTPPGKTGGYKSTNGDGPPWIYTWEVNDETGHYTVTLTVNEDDEGSGWSMKIDGVMDGTTLIDFTWLEGWQSKDEKTGNFTVYDYIEQPEIMFELSWSTSADNIYTLTVDIPEDEKITITSNPDNSGHIECFEWTGGDYLILFKADWTPEGHGEYWEYENGVLQNHGTW